MTLSSKTQAILLLTTHFPKTESSANSPLTPKEWGRFALWLKEKKISPEQLITGCCLDDVLHGWSDKKITLPRIDALINRGAALGLAMDKWSRSGLWVMTRSDTDYPRRLINKLGYDAPAVLFGCGERRLLNGGGLAVVGSRSPSPADLAFSRDLGELASNAAYSVVSGGARGVDQNAMAGALEAEGTVIGVLADSLLSTVSSTRYRGHLMAKNLVLVSPFQPEAGWNVGNAMQRNKYVYCLSDAAVVVYSETKGGTWTGARENLKKQWVPLWVKKTKDKSAGNSALVEGGARWITEDIKNINIPRLFENGAMNQESEVNLFDKTPATTYRGSVIESREMEPSSVSTEETDTASRDDSGECCADSPEINRASELPEFYELFLQRVRLELNQSTKKPGELAEAMALKKAQLKLWLDQAEKENKICKVSLRPVRYEWVDMKQTSLDG